MNQLVAPTSFITSISRRRANIAVRIVFQISRIEANSSTPDITSVRTPKKLFSLLSTAIWSVGKAHLVDLGQLGERVRQRCAATRRIWSLSIGSTLKYDGTFSSERNCQRLGVAGEQLVGLRQRARSSQYSTFSISSVPGSPAPP